MKRWVLFFIFFCLAELFVSNHVLKWGDKIIFEHKAYIKCFQR